MREPERAVDPTLTKEFQKLYTAASKCAEVRILLDVRFHMSPGVSLGSCLHYSVGRHEHWVLHTDVELPS